MHTLIHESTEAHDVLFLQEPWWDKLGTGTEATVKAGPGWRCLLPRNPLPRGQRPRVLAFYRARQDFTATPRYDILDDPDAMAVEVRQRGARPTIYINVYNQLQDVADGADGRRRTTFERLFLDPTHPHRIPDDVAVVFTGDMNEHHPWWEVMDSEPRSARAMADWFRDAGYALINPFNEATFATHNSGTRSVLDLTFANRAAQHAACVQDWRIDPASTNVSDHFGLLWFTDPSLEPITNETGARYNFKKGDEDLFCRVVRQELDNAGDTFTRLAYTGRPVPHEHIEHAARTYQDALVAAADAAVPRRRESAYAKPWWGADLDKALGDVKNAKSALRFCAPHEEERRSTDLSHASNVFRRLARKTKREYFRALLANASTKELWEYKTWTAGKRSYPTPPLRRAAGEPLVTTHADKCTALRAVHFAPPTDLGIAMPDLSVPRPHALPAVPTTRAEVRTKLFSGGQDKAPGPSGIIRRGLRWAWRVADNEYTLLISACVDNGYQPIIWRQTIAACLAKPGKPDYSLCKAYRLIVCEEEPSKDVEKVETDRFAHLGLQLGLISETQFGGVPGRSVDDAALTFVHDVERAGKEGLVTSALTFDISGYFDKVNHARLLTILAESRLPTVMVQWVASFLTGRQATICLDGVRDEMQEVLNGIPQGSSVSPILAGIFSNSLGQRLAAQAPVLRQLLPNSMAPTEGRLIMYVDDGKIYVSSRSFNVNNRHLRALYTITLRWARDFGVSLDTDKRDFSHYVVGVRRLNGRKIGTARPALSLPRPGAADDILPAQRCYRWLGIWWDPGLHFTAHVTQMAERAGNAVTALAMLGTTTTGLSPAQLRTVHIACTLSILCFGATVWYTGDRQLGRIKRLDVVLRRALRHVLGAFKTTPSDALYVESSIPPMELTLQSKLSRAAIRFATFPAEHPIRQRLGGAWSDGASGAYAPPLPPSDSESARDLTRLQRIARRYPADGERVDTRLRAPWDDFVNDPRWSGRLLVKQKTSAEDKRGAARAHVALAKTLRADPTNLIVYTDGSLLAERAGAGAALYTERRQVGELKLGLGVAGETFDGELYGLARAARDAVIYAGRHDLAHIFFFADNDAAVGRAFERAPQAGQIFSVMFADSIEQYLLSDDRNRVTIAWVPGHEGLAGQEVSDRMAKAGTVLPSSLPVSITITRAKRAVSDKLNEAWHNLWLSNTRRNLYSPANRIPPSTRPTPHLRTLDKSTYARVLQCRTGHAFTGEYNRAINKPDRGLACVCGAPLQTRDHLLAHCPELERYRGALRDVSPQLDVAHLLGTREGIAAVAKFTRRSGAFGRPAALDARDAE